MKKYTNRPALRAVEVWRWIQKGILETKVLRDPPIFYLTRGKSVRQRWLKRVKGKVQTETAITYLRKGIFLVPRWFPVPHWEIDYLSLKDGSLNQDGIIFFEQRYYRLCYMQVEDLNHILRQQDHVLDDYFRFLLEANFPDFWERFSIEAKIIQKIGDRKVSADNLHAVVEIRLKSLARSLSSIIDRSPLFRESFSDKERERSGKIAIAVFHRTVQECQTFVFRPVFRRLGYAARSLELAAEHIQNDRLDLAKKRLQSALKNLTYPSET